MDEEKEIIWANGNPIQMIYANDPAEIDYTAYGINNAIVVDNTGVWRDREGLSQHLQSKGVDRVLLTAPGKGDIPNIVYGINQDMIGDERILSAASCTTNGITPVLKVINDRYGVKHGHVETRRRPCLRHCRSLRASSPATPSACQPRTCPWLC